MRASLLGPPMDDAESSEEDERTVSFFDGCVSSRIFRYIG